MIRVKIRKVSAWFIGAAVVMGGLFFALSAWSNREFHILQEETDRYMLCEQAAKDMQDGSDYLTEQVRMYAMTGRTEYMENYFTESTETCRREVAVEKLRPYFEGTHTFEALQSALDYSKDLMRTEYYAMRLVAEAEHGDRSAWPSAIQDVTLTEEDQALSIRTSSSGPRRW